MPGQGSPQSRSPPRRAMQRRGGDVLRRTVRLLLLAVALSITFCVSLPCWGEELDVRLRIAWGGGESRPWQGSIAISAGRLLDPIPLGLEADAPGSMLPIDERTIRIVPRSPRSYDGCDFRVQAPADARLIVRLRTGGAPPGEPLELPLSHVVQGIAQFDLDDRQNRLLAHRSPGDALRVHFDRPSLVFASGDRFEFDVEPSAPSLAPGATYLLAAALGPARTDEQFWNEDHAVQVDDRGRANKVHLAIPLPTDEGVYDIHLALYPKRLTTSFVRGKPLFSRKVQVVVLSPVKLIDRQGAAWQTQLEFDPASPRWWERMTRLPPLRRLPTLPQHPVSSGRAEPRLHIGQTWLELAPQAWQAYPLSIEAQGTPHIIEVEYPSDVEQTLGISLVEPNAAGQVGPIGVDSGIDVAAPVAGHKPAVRRHRLVVWPQTSSPHLLVVNRRDDLPAVVGKIRVLSGPKSLSPLAVAPPNFAARTLAAYFDKPLMAENFSATEALDPVSGRSLDDWVTFYEGGQRLVQALQHGGYNAVVLTVACEGSAIYPSDLIQPTPKYDMGAFFESGQDAVRKDVLELILRLCDRSGIQVIPAVQFAAPLAKLEAIRLADGQGAAGIEPLGPDGRTWLERNGPGRQTGVYYNALDERVQAAMIEVVAELADRYAHHPCFGGVAVQLSADSYSLLPDETCSYDERTVERFAAATRAEVPLSGDAESLAARARYLAGPGAGMWQLWRSRELTKLYVRMRDEVVRRRAGARLVLTTGDLLGSRPVQQALRPSLTTNADPAAVLPLLGIDLAALSEAAIIVPRPQRVVAACEPEERALHLYWNDEPELTALFAAKGRAAAMHFLEPAPLRLPDFDAVSPFSPEKTRTLLISQIAPAEAAARQRFARSIARLDAPLVIDGGWLLTLGQEESLAPLVKVYRRLPAEPFTTPRPASPPAKTQGIVVRTLNKNGKTYFYAVNETPWPVTAEIDFESAGAFQLQSYADDRAAALREEGNRSTWTVAMEPFDLVGGELSNPRVRVIDWRMTPPASASAEVRARVDDFGRRIATFRSPPPPRDWVVNPSFEDRAADVAVAGWVHNGGPGIEVNVDRARGHQSASSLHVASRAPLGGAAPIVWVRSAPFEAPRTGRFAVSAWIRVADAARQPKLRLSIESKLDGQIYYKRANVGASEDGNPVKPLTAEFSPFIFPVTELPQRGLTELQVGFDLMGEGEVWIDDVQVIDLWLEGPEYHALLSRMAIVKSTQLADGELAECQAFVDGYWPSFLRRHVKLDEPRALPALDGPPLPQAPNNPVSSNGTARSARNKTDDPPPTPRWRSWLPSWPKWR